MTRNQAIYGVVVDLAARIVFLRAMSMVRSDLGPKARFWSENEPLQSSSASVVSGFERIANTVSGWRRSEALSGFWGIWRPGLCS